MAHKPPGQWLSLWRGAGTPGLWRPRPRGSTYPHFALSRHIHMHLPPSFHHIRRHSRDYCSPFSGETEAQRTEGLAQGHPAERASGVVPALPSAYWSFPGFTPPSPAGF